ncbi:MAG TPA: PspC domain-containing protein [Candidatus Microsaccharimonas sp.]|jgi:phage shock protein PspC (stress-responsive transcriptional regulator)
MKDITRIHIAKVPYNVELSAKKYLEKYIATLEAYTNDSELLGDIEIRITELLLERGVKQDDVISEADVKAVREQLGEPKDFMTDEATLEIDPELLSSEAKRTLYRNLDTALLGGVLGGIASYFRINALWIRLAFIILTFVSFGLAVLLYVVLWLIIPPARTAAEKLQLAGRQVTLASIRELNENGSGVDIERRTRIQKRVATTIVGLIGIVSAVASVAALVVAAIELARNGQSSGFESYAPYQLAIIFAFSAGVLLTILSLLVASAAFAQKFNKQIWISGIVIIILGLGSFGGAVIASTYEHQLQYDQVLRNTVDTIVKTPDNYASVKTLSVDIQGTANVVYVADDSVTSIKQRSLKDAPKVDVTVENGVLRVKLAFSNQTNGIADNTITLYGPRLESIIVSNGYVSYSATSQPSLKTEVYNGSSLRLTGSRIDNLTVKTDETAQLFAEDAAVANVKASVYGQSSVGLGNIKSLDVTNPDVCASNQTAKLSVENIVSASYTHNGIEEATKSTKDPCLSIQFNSDQSATTEYQN